MKKSYCIILFAILAVTLLPHAASAQGSGSALVFDGSSNYVNIPSASDLDIVGAITIEAWLNITSFHSNWNYVLFHGNYKYEFGFYNTDGKPRFKPYSTAGSYEVAGNALSTGKWYHIAGVRNGSSVKIYVNGVLKSSRSDFSGDLKSGAYMQIGGQQGPSDCFNGTIDEVRIWNVERTADSIRADMCRKVGPGNGLVACWRLDDGSGTTTADASSNGHTGTLVGPPTWGTSGASLGDASTYNYSSPTSVTLASADGDNINVGTIAGSPDGIQIYRVDQAPNVTTPPSGYNNVDPLRYWGVFIAGGTSPTYTVTYDYTGHPGIGNENYLKLAYRSDNSTTSWTDLGATLDVTANTLTKTGQSGTEYVLGSTTSDNPLPVQASSFKAIADFASVTLKWKTQAEVNNAGFNVLREDLGISSFKLVGSYITNDGLKGLGTSSSGRPYSFTDNKVTSGSTYQYKIQSVSQSMTTNDLVTLTVTVDVPKTYALYQNYPNPFNPSTSISYQLSAVSHVVVKVYDALGREVTTLVDEQQNAGVYKVPFNGGKYASGAYFCRLTAIPIEQGGIGGKQGQTFTAVKEMLLAK
jgi:hypothetical protein